MMMTNDERKTYPFAALLTDVRVLTENLKDFKKKYRSQVKIRKIMEKVRGYQLLGDVAKAALVLEELTVDVHELAERIGHEANLEADNRDIKSK